LQSLFFFNAISPGSCFFQPHGARLYNTLMNFIKQQYWLRGYDEVPSPRAFSV
jgi:threonyl-tRNA synthetase